MVVAHHEKASNDLLPRLASKATLHQQASPPSRGLGQGKEERRRPSIYVSCSTTMAFASIQKFIYGPSPEERVKSWQQQIKKEARLLDREMRGIDTAQSKTKAQLKQLANKGDIKNAKLLAREVVRSNKQKDRLATSKARLNSVNMQLSHQLCKSSESALKY